MHDEEQKQTIIKKYIDEMEIIKLRTNQIFTATQRFELLEPAVEYKALQLRKIIEQIVLASLITNAEEYKKQYNRLGKEWNAKWIAKDLGRINPDFFPKPVNNRSDFIIESKVQVLNCEQLIDAYEKMGKYLHSHNPFDAEKWDYQAVSDYIDSVTRRIIYTLNSHNITLLGGDVFLNVVMKASGTDQVNIAWFEKCDESEQRKADLIIKQQMEILQQ